MQRLCLRLRPNLYFEGDPLLILSHSRVLPPLNFSLGGWPICRPKKKPQTSVVLFSLFFSFFFKGSLIVLIQMYWINFYYSKFRISKRNAVFCVAFIDDVTSFFFFLKVNIYFGARRGEVWKIRGRNLFPECFRTKEKSMKKYIRVIIVKRRSSRRVVKFLDKNLRTIRINIVKFCERGGKSRLWIREENSIYSLLVWYSILESSKLCDVAK